MKAAKLMNCTAGEVMCSSYQAFGAAGLITSGAGRDLDQVEALGQRPLVREVVDRREQLPVGQVAGAAEDH